MMFPSPSPPPGLPPIFDSDAPDALPALRRVKPLPKRRRTSTSNPASHQRELELHSTPGGAVAVAVAHAEDNGNGTGAESHQEGTEAGQATPNRPAQTALQTYYGSPLDGIFRSKHTLPHPHTHEPDGGPIDLGAALAAGFAAGAGWDGYAYDGQDDDGDGDGGDGDGDRGDGDGEDGEGDGGEYVDHLQQPGNTKKRKVPANVAGSAHGAGGSGAEDEGADRAVFTGRERDADADIGAIGSGGGGPGAGAGPGGGGGLHPLTGKRGRISRATLAGLQHKALLKSRKRQLAAVLGERAQSDTLALDQALSAYRLFVQPQTRVHLSRRRTSRFTRALKVYLSTHPSVKDRGEEAEVPSADFTFVCRSVASERLVATNEEVAELQRRFQDELARQAAKAAEAAQQAAAAATLNGPLAKRTTGAKQALRTAAPSGKGGNDSASSKGALEQQRLLLEGAKGKGSKKKKRSALANASNPHHLRNYVPSRLPHSGPPSAQQALQNAQNLLAPLPLRFLSAEIPPRRRKKKAAAAGAGAGAGVGGEAQSVPPAASVPLANPAEEWICPFCDYQLFYGDEGSYAVAVRNRKKILRRRRRARERAAAAASGTAGAAGASAGTQEEEQGEFEVAGGVAVGREVGASAGKQGKWKEGDRGGAQGVVGHG